MSWGSLRIELKHPAFLSANGQTILAPVHSALNPANSSSSVWRISFGSTMCPAIAEAARTYVKQDKLFQAILQESFGSARLR